MIELSFADTVEARRRIELRIILKALKDKEFRNRLLTNPSEVYGQELGAAFPPELKVEVLQEDVNTLYLVLPVEAPEIIQIEDGNQELSDEALETMTGGLNSEVGGQNGLAWLSYELLHSIMENK